MQISVNGEPLALDTGAMAKLGEALSAADELLETGGFIIVGLRLDGKALDAESLAQVKDLALAEAGQVDIDAQPLSEIKVKAVETLLEFVSLAGEAAAGKGQGDWPALASGLGELAEAFAGLFSADELSFVQSFAALVGRTLAENPPAAKEELRAEIGFQADRLALVFKERLQEIQSPIEEMRKTAALYESQVGELKDLPVLLQTGKDERAMKAVLLFIEIFNKVIRLIPELERRGLDSSALRVAGEELPAFYSSFNDILRRLSTAFEDRDSVLIGDLAEYEVAPRMSEFFGAIEEALPKP